MVELDPKVEAVVADIYPYARDPQRHPLACLFFNGPVKLDVEAAEAMARHVFEHLDCAPPRAPRVKYDALGSSGAPWEPGVWIASEKDRMTVHVTVSEKPVADMDDAELAALRRELNAVEDARRAGTLGGV